MSGFSIQDWAILCAYKNGSLEIKETKSRFGSTFTYLADAKVIIEVFDNDVEAQSAIDKALTIGGVK